MEGIEIGVWTKKVCTLFRFVIRFVMRKVNDNQKGRVYNEKVRENISLEDKVMIPNDPVMLLSFVNMKLRDKYVSLNDMCEDLDISSTEVIEKLGKIDYHYDVEKNQFI